MFGLVRRNWPGFPRRGDIDRLVDDFFGDLGSIAHNGQIAIPLDVLEKDNEFVVRMELPGVAEQDIDIRLESDILTVHGEKRREEKHEGEDYHLVESHYGAFTRTVRLPSDMDGDKVSAAFDKGVLTITLPKTEAAVARKIEIKGK